jgi:uncharacterized protein YprB with RNaseH-like and TPR domain
MSGLRERLSRFKKPEADRVAVPASAAASAGDDWAKLGAHLETSEWGAFILRRRVYSQGSRHGRYQLAELADCAGELSRFHESAEVGLERLLFFDTETTGLGVGAGNVPFMVGIGYYTEGQFVVEQLFMRSPSEELAMLRYLQDKLSRYTHIVSYNGRCFDWPILKNRYVLNRLGFNDHSLLQLDLLYPSRSLWRNCLPSCRLSIVEEYILGFKRVGDVPGSLAPTLYFQYLVEKDAQVLKGLFIHNELDIVSLAALATHFGKLLSGKDASGSSEVGKPANPFGFSVNVHDEETYRIGVWLDKMGRDDLAEAVFEQMRSCMMESPVVTEQTAQAMLQLAAYYKKKGAHGRASQLWLRQIEGKSSSLTTNLEPYIELAMYYEHREKDIQQALFYTEQAWTKLWRRRSLSRSDKKQSEQEQMLKHRMERLNLKLQQLQTKAPRASKKGRSSLTLDPTEQTHYASGTANLRGHHTASAGSRKKRRSKPVYVMDSLI